MRIVIGSKNDVKVDAVRETAEEYPLLQGATFEGFDAASGVSDQPKGLEETLRGAITRAKAAYASGTYDLAFGIESGIVEVPYTKSGWMDVTTCAIHDGKEIHLGLSSLFECPLEVTRLMVEEGMNMNDAMRAAGHTSESKLGSGIGAIGVLTKGRITRKDYTKQAIRLAMIHLEDGHEGTGA
jgi:inosine/xanthosine triphosphatase